MIENEILKGYDGALVDGFHDNSGFSSDHLTRKFERNFGYYLHLHGSPLFVDHDGITVKLKKKDLLQQTEVVSSHIVLTHFKHKPTIISGSDVLHSYWQFLAKAFDESEEIILVGYSGADSHLNALIQSHSKIPVRVVEWEGAGDADDQETYWCEQCLRKTVSLEHYGSILDFNNWA